MLGGGVEVRSDGRPDLTAAGERVVLGVLLWRAGWTARLVASGPYEPIAGGGATSNAAATAALWEQLGVPVGEHRGDRGPAHDHRRDRRARTARRRARVAKGGPGDLRVAHAAGDGTVRRRGLQVTPLPAETLTAPEPQLRWLVPEEVGVWPVQHARWNTSGALWAGEEARQRSAGGGLIRSAPRGAGAGGGCPGSGASPSPTPGASPGRCPRERVLGHPGRGRAAGLAGDARHPGRTRRPTPPCKAASSPGWERLGLPVAVRRSFVCSGAAPVCGTGAQPDRPTARRFGKARGPARGPLRLGRSRRGDRRRPGERRGARRGRPRPFDRPAGGQPGHPPDRRRRGGRPARRRGVHHRRPPGPGRRGGRQPRGPRHRRREHHVRDQ